MKAATVRTKRATQSASRAQSGPSGPCGHNRGRSPAFGPAGTGPASALWADGREVVLAGVLSNLADNRTAPDHPPFDKLNRLGNERKRSLRSAQSLVVLARQLANSSPEALVRALEAYRRLDLTPTITREVYQTSSKRAKWLNKSELQGLVTGYQAGATVYTLAVQFGIHRTTVAQHLKQQGVCMRRHSPTEGEIDEMVRLYESGLSLAKVGHQLGFDDGTVHIHIRSRGVRTRDTHGR